MEFNPRLNRTLEAAVIEWRENYPDKIAWEFGLLEASARIKAADKKRKFQSPPKEWIMSLRAPVKQLLAHELSIPEVAERIGKSVRAIQQVVSYYDMRDFIQPALKKERWRDKLKLIKIMQDNDTCFREQLPLTLNYHYNKLINEGWSVDKSDLRGELGVVYAECLTTYDSKRNAAFKTYFERAAQNRMMDWRNTTAQETAILTPYYDENDTGGGN